MELLNSYMGLMLLVFGCLISTLLVFSRMKQARYEQENQAQWSVLNNALRDQQQAGQQATQALQDQVHGLSHVQSKTSKVLLSHIMRNNQSQQSIAEEQQVLSAALQSHTAELNDAMQQIEEQVKGAGQEALAAAEQRCSAIITEASDRHLESLLQQMRDDREEIQSGIAAETETLSELIKGQVQQTAELQNLQALMQTGKAELQQGQEQSVKTLYAGVSRVLKRQLDLRQESLEQYAEKTENSVAAVTDTIREQLDHQKKALLSGIENTAEDIKQFIDFSEESLRAESQSLAAALQQLNYDIEEYISVASEGNVSAIMDVYENLQSLFENEISAVQSGLQTVTYTVENTALDAEEKYLSAVETASEQIQNHLRDDNTAVFSNLQAIEHAVHAIENKVSQ